MNITQHISYKEAVRTKSKFDNTPNEEQLSKMRSVAYKVFEPLRVYYGVPIYVSSFFRSEMVNTDIGGSKTSQHMKGEAMDLDAHVYGEITNKQIFEFIRNFLNYDQLIWEEGNDNEPAWVHVSYKEKGNRFETLRMKDGNYWEIKDSESV